MSELFVYCDPRRSARHVGTCDWDPHDHDTRGDYYAAFHPLCGVRVLRLVSEWDLAPVGEYTGEDLCPACQDALSRLAVTADA